MPGTRIVVRFFFAARLLLAVEALLAVCALRARRRLRASILAAVFGLTASFFLYRGPMYDFHTGNTSVF